MSKEETNDSRNSGSSGTILIKKYPNRRLYNTKTSAYIVLDDIVELVKADIPFVIEDKKTGEDITRSILNQIIFDRETSGANSNYHFPLEVQKQLIGMYDDAYSTMIPDFLKQSLNMFKDEQTKMQSTMKDVVDKNSKLMMDMTTNMARQNMELFKKSMDLFTNPLADQGQTASASKEEDESGTDRGTELEDLQNQINALQERLKQMK